MSDAILSLNGQREAARKGESVLSVVTEAAVPRSRYKWLAGRYVTRASLPPLQRFLYDLWHRRLRVPPPKIESLLGTFDTRIEAVGHCRDENDYVMRLPHGRPYGAEVRKIEGYCRPLDPQHAKLNESEAERYQCEGENEELRETVSFLTDTLSEQVRDISRRMNVLEGEITGHKRGAATSGRKSNLGISAAAAAPQ